jgi:hypothetical protein
MGGGEWQDKEAMKEEELVSNQNISPTIYPDVNVVLNELLPDVQKVLGNQFISMYLHGSLAGGGFDQDSDVDFVVITKGDLPEALFSALQSMHMHIATLNSWCATQLEGSYIPLHALQQYDPVHALHLHIDRAGRRDLAECRSMIPASAMPGGADGCSYARPSGKTGLRWQVPCPKH